jgi:hypothetical protein
MAIFQLFKKAAIGGHFKWLLKVLLFYLDPRG